MNFNVTTLKTFPGKTSGSTFAIIHESEAGRVSFRPFAMPKLGNLVAGLKVRFDTPSAPKGIPSYLSGENYSAVLHTPVMKMPCDGGAVMEAIKKAVPELLETLLEALEDAGLKAQYKAVTIEQYIEAAFEQQYPVPSNHKLPISIQWEQFTPSDD